METEAKESERSVSWEKKRNKLCKSDRSKEQKGMGTKIDVEKEIKDKEGEIWTLKKEIKNKLTIEQEKRKKLKKREMQT